MTPSTTEIPGGIPTSPQRPTHSRRWTVLGVGAAVLCIALSAFIGSVAVAFLNAPYGDSADLALLWGFAGCVTSIPPILAGLSCLVYFASRSTAVLHVTRTILFAGIAVMIVQSILGFLVAMQSEAKGGDWRGIAVIASYVFCVAPPLLVGALCAFLLLPLWKLGRMGETS